MATSIQRINLAFLKARGRRGKRRLAFAATALAIAASLGAAPALAGWIGNVDLLTRGDGSVLPVYEKARRARNTRYACAIQRVRACSR